MDGHGEDHEGFHVEHEYHQSGDGHYEPPKSVGAMSSHGELMDHIHEHTSKHGEEDCPCGMCGEGGDNETDKNVEIDRLSVAEMKDNRWHQRNITFNSSTTNYTVRFLSYLS